MHGVGVEKSPPDRRESGRAGGWVNVKVNIRVSPRAKSGQSGRGESPWRLLPKSRWSHVTTGLSADPAALKALRCFQLFLQTYGYIFTLPHRSREAVWTLLPLVAEIRHDRLKKKMNKKGGKKANEPGRHFQASVEVKHVSPARAWRCAGWSSAGDARWRSWCRTARSCCSRNPRSRRCPALQWTGAEEQNKKKKKKRLRIYIYFLSWTLFPTKKAAWHQSFMSILCPYL